jgi:hypothetical protein
MIYTHHMFTTYHIKTDEISKKLIDDIRQRFKKDEKLTVTVTSEEHRSVSDKMLEFLEIEKKFPLKRVPQSLDFNELTDEINLEVAINVLT